MHSVYSLKNFLPQYCKVLGIQTARFSNKKPKWYKNKPTTKKNKHNSNNKKTPYTCSILQTPTIIAKIQAFFHSSHTLFLLIQIDYQTRLFYYYFIFLRIENYPVIYIKTWNSYAEIQVTLSFFLPRFLIWGNSDFPQIDGQFQIELQNSYT